MIPRYQTKFMNELFSDDTKFATWFLIERTYLAAYLEAHGTPDEALKARLVHAQTAIDWRKFATRVLHYENDVKHDVIAFLHALEDEIGADARLIHCGLTSSDVVDTSLALMLKHAHGEVSKKLRDVIEMMWHKAKAYRGVMCLGRTHGQAAEPITFGIKLLSHVSELLRGYERLMRAGADIAVGKLSGATGVYALIHPDIEARALAQLGLACETVATQVVARDRHAAYFSALAVLAGSIERFATEIRLLMHGQTKEVSEPFSSKQKGSSAMPHKKNPILSENLCGLMRMIRAYATAAFENQALWHERDISHSSVERIIIPDTLSIMDFALSRLKNLVEHLSVDATKMAENLKACGSALSSQKFMLALIMKGHSRQKAYELVQSAALKTGELTFDQALKAVGIMDMLGASTCSELLASENVVVHEDVLFARVEALMGKLAV